MKEIEFDLMERATLFTLTLRSWGNRSKADMNKMETKAGVASPLRNGLLSLLSLMLSRNT